MEDNFGLGEDKIGRMRARDETDFTRFHSSEEMGRMGPIGRIITLGGTREGNWHSCQRANVCLGIGPLSGFRKSGNGMANPVLSFPMIGTAEYAEVERLDYGESQRLRLAQSSQSQR